MSKIVLTHLFKHQGFSSINNTHVSISDWFYLYYNTLIKNLVKFYRTLWQMKIWFFFCFFDCLEFVSWSLLLRITSWDCLSRLSLYLNTRTPRVLCVQLKLKISWQIQKKKNQIVVKFIYSEKATKFWEIFFLLLTTVRTGEDFAKFYGLFRIYEL